MSLSFSVPSIAQQIGLETQWDFKIGSNSEFPIRSGVEIGDGGIVLTGSTTSRFAMKKDGWIVKLDVKGNQEWEYINGEKGNDQFYEIIKTSDNAYVAIGQTEVNSEKKGWILKLDAQGNKLWEKFIGSGINNNLFHIIETSDGGFILMGLIYFINKENLDPWLVSINREGEIQWEKTLGSNVDNYIGNFKQLNDGTFIASGFSVNADREQTAFLYHFDRNGGILQEKRFPNELGSRFHDVAVGTNGDFLAIGVINSNQSRNSKSWLVRLDAEMNTLEEAQNSLSGLNRLQFIRSTPKGGYLLLGSKQNSNNEKENIAIGLDRQLSAVWSQKIDIPANSNLSNAFYQSQEEIILTGQINSSSDPANAYQGWAKQLRLITPQMKVKQFVYQKIEEWKQKSEFEKTEEFLARVTAENRLKKAKEFERIVLNNLKNELRGKIRAEDFQIGNYDADNETFLLYYLGNKFIVAVPNEEAPVFKGIFDQALFGNVDYILNGEYLRISHFEIQHPSLSRTYSWDYTTDYPYEPTEIRYNFGGLPSLASKNDPGSSRTKRIAVDTDIPLTSKQKPNTYALIIGNEDYRSYQPNLNFEANVQFAVNDAKIFKEYCIKTLGVPARNTTLLTNATLAQMTTAIDRLIKLAEVSNGQAELIFYYAGHGFPDQQTKEAYIMPVDVSGSNVQIAIKLRDLYAKLAQFPTQRVSVFLDACFSGAGRGAGLLASRGVRIRPKNDLVKGNMVVFTSSSGEESSGPYSDKQHGLFTYFLLEKIKTSQGNITYAELADYLSATVPKESILINNQRQNPSVLFGNAVKGEWRKWEL